MNIASGAFTLIILLYFGVLFINSNYQGVPDEQPKIQAFPSNELLEKNKRISDLFTIAQALEKYKREHGFYPLGSDNPKWSSCYTNDECSNANWIVDLSPKYIAKLPNDPRSNNENQDQYFYISNGANYRLYANNPEDCALIKSIAPELVVPVGDCLGYGFWTADAGHQPYWIW